MNIDKKILDSIESTQDLNKLDLKQLEQLCAELRNETIETVSVTGGHLGAGLGVVELTVALHTVFDTPKDQIIWDVGHQTYPHKILTGRKDRILTLRQPGGLSGFPKRSESEFDTFGVGHSSTSISAALGMAVARDLKSYEKKEVIAVIGDGAMSAGLAYEAMNNAGAKRNRMIVILNDNDMSIAPAVGALNTYLSKLISSKPYLGARSFAKRALNFLPKSFKKLVKKTERNTKDLFNDSNFFEGMGFYYIGPIDGHNINDLIQVLSNVRDDKTITRPILIHVRTEKGKGFISPEFCHEKYHAVAKFDPKTNIQKKSNSGPPSYTKIFASSLIREAKNDDKIVAITAAMPSGTGLDKFEEKFPDRMFDVGIAEQHAVTFAAGLACEGMKPFVAIYSTFLQRAFDQVVHDVSIQKLPVRFCIDRAGYVGGDGPTHAGAFDIAYLCSLPNMIVMAPANEVELSNMVATAAKIDDAPSAIRYPRGPTLGMTLPKAEILEIGKGRIIRQGKDIAILSLGTRLSDSFKAAEKLVGKGFDITVADARFAKPLDKDLIRTLARNHKIIITVEEGSIGGFGSHVNAFLIASGLLDGELKVRNLHYPDYHMDHSTQELMHKEAKVDADSIIKTILEITEEEIETLVA